MHVAHVTDAYITKLNFHLFCWFSSPSVTALTISNFSDFLCEPVKANILGFRIPFEYFAYKIIENVENLADKNDKVDISVGICHHQSMVRGVSLNGILNFCIPNIFLAFCVIIRELFSLMALNKTCPRTVHLLCYLKHCIWTDMI